MTSPNARPPRAGRPSDATVTGDGEGRSSDERALGEDRALEAADVVEVGAGALGDLLGATGPARMCAWISRGGALRSTATACRGPPAAAATAATASTGSRNSLAGVGRDEERAALDSDDPQILHVPRLSTVVIQLARIATSDGRVPGNSDGRAASSHPGAVAERPLLGLGLLFDNE